MDFSLLEQRLKKFDISNSDMELVEDRVTSIAKALVFANESTDKHRVYLVFKNNGTFSLFRTVDDHVINDKLGNSYSESRNVVALESWNFRCAFRLSVLGNKVNVDKVGYNEIVRVVNRVRKPKEIRYAIGVDEGFTPALVDFDLSLYSGLTYKQYKDCLLAAYKRKVLLALDGQVMESKVEEPCIHIVSYA